MRARKTGPSGSTNANASRLCLTAAPTRPVSSPIGTLTAEWRSCRHPRASRLPRECRLHSRTEKTSPRWKGYSIWTAKKSQFQWAWSGGDSFLAFPPVSQGLVASSGLSRLIHDARPSHGDSRRATSKTRASRSRQQSLCHSHLFIVFICFKSQMLVVGLGQCVWV